VRYYTSHMSSDSMPSFADKSSLESSKAWWLERSVAGRTRYMFHGSRNRLNTLAKLTFVDIAKRDQTDLQVMSIAICPRGWFP